MLDGQGYDISCDLVMKVSVGGQVRSSDSARPTHTTNLSSRLICLYSGGSVFVHGDV
jgi:hypothetical protein